MRRAACCGCAVAAAATTNAAVAAMPARNGEVRKTLFVVRHQHSWCWILLVNTDACVLGGLRRAVV